MANKHMLTSLTITEMQANYKGYHLTSLEWLVSKPQIITRK